MHDLLETALGLLQLLLQYCYSWGGRAPRSHTKGDLSSDCLPIASVFNWKIEVIYTWSVIAQCILFVSIGTSSSRKVVCIMYSLLMIIIRQAWPVHHMDGSNELFSFIFFWPKSSLLTFYRMWRHQIIATCPCKHHSLLEAAISALGTMFPRILLEADSSFRHLYSGHHWRTSSSLLWRPSGLLFSACCCTRFLEVRFSERDLPVCPVRKPL